MNTINQLLFNGTTKFVAAAPTLTKLNTTLSAEAKIGIGICVIGLMIWFLVKQKIGAAIGTLIAGALIFFFISDPTAVLDSIGAWFGQIFK